MQNIKENFLLCSLATREALVSVNYNAQVLITSVSAGDSGNGNHVIHKVSNCLFALFFSFSFSRKITIVVYPSLRVAGNILARVARSMVSANQR